jgi:carbonic anhydrase/acetyltransferase-like protein (isoleucine patch superfamily)
LPEVLVFEDRALLSSLGLFASELFNPAGTQAVRPNTPVLPYGTPTGSGPTFIDPTASIINGNHVVIGTKSFIAPFATLNARSGFLKIGTGSAVLDNATITTVANAITTIGDDVEIGYDATVSAAASIGAFGADAKATGIGPGANIGAGATIKAGSFVGALATVGPGVTVPSGIYVLAGALVGTDAEASNPALGKVVVLPSSIKTALTTQLTRDTALAAGYTNLYQGNPATGVSPGVPASTTGVNNGSLAAVEGASQEPGAATSTVVTGINFEPSKATGPKFLGPGKPSVEGAIYNFKGRVTGDVRFTDTRAIQVEKTLGKRNSIRGDQGQPITFAGPPATGTGVTITSPLGGVTISGSTTTTTGTMKIGTNFRTGDHVVLLGGPQPSYTIGNNVYIGSGAVVTNSSFGDNVTIGPRAYVAGSKVAASTEVPPGEILIGNKVVGMVQA